MKKIFVSILVIIFFAACGGGSSGNSSSIPGGGDTIPPNNNVEMSIGTVYTVYPGDIIARNVDQTYIRISHYLDSNESTVMLLEGNATIVRH